MIGIIMVDNNTVDCSLNNQYAEPSEVISLDGSNSEFLEFLWPEKET